MIKIKFLKNVPENKEIETWVDTWECFHYPDVTVYKKEDVIFIDIPEMDNYISESYLSKLYKLENVWISGWTPTEGLTTFLYSDTDGKNKIDYSKIVGWKPNEKDLDREHYNILKNMGFGIEYIRFSLLNLSSKFEKIIDRCIDLDEPDFDEELWIKELTEKKNV